MTWNYLFLRPNLERVCCSSFLHFNASSNHHQIFIVCKHKPELIPLKRFCSLFHCRGLCFFWRDLGPMGLHHDPIHNKMVGIFILIFWRKSPIAWIEPVNTMTHRLIKFIRFCGALVDISIIDGIALLWMIRRFVAVGSLTFADRKMNFYPFSDWLEQKYCECYWNTLYVCVFNSNLAILVQPFEIE